MSIPSEVFLKLEAMGVWWERDTRKGTLHVGLNSWIKPKGPKK